MLSSSFRSRKRGRTYVIVKIDWVGLRWWTVQTNECALAVLGIGTPKRWIPKTRSWFKGTEDITVRNLSRCSLESRDRKHYVYMTRGFLRDMVDMTIHEDLRASIAGGIKTRYSKPLHTSPSTR